MKNNGKNLFAIIVICVRAVTVLMTAVSCGKGGSGCDPELPSLRIPALPPVAVD